MTIIIFLDFLNNQCNIGCMFNGFRLLTIFKCFNLSFWTM
jgi:hypothetical protein